MDLERLFADDLSIETPASDVEYSISPQLTHDEHKAAEAAFRGLPSNPNWSHAARRVYEGLTAAMVKRERSSVKGSAACFGFDA